jgi:putative aldouronate transport system substrate-binding protein
MDQLQGPDRPIGALTLSGFDRGFSIAAASESKADNIFKFLNWVYTGGYDFMRYGVEGKTYTVSSDGVKVSIPNDDREAGWQGPNMEPFGFPPKQDDVWPKWNEQERTYADRGVPEKLGETVKMYKTSADNAMPNYNHLTVSPTATEKGSQLSQQYIIPMQEKFAIDPNLSPDTWDNAISSWRAAGGDQIIAEVNEIQQVKSPIKPVYEVPDDYKKYLS